MFQCVNNWEQMYPIIRQRLSLSGYICATDTMYPLEIMITENTYSLVPSVIPWTQHQGWRAVVLLLLSWRSREGSRQNTKGGQAPHKGLEVNKQPSLRQKTKNQVWRATFKRGSGKASLKKRESHKGKGVWPLLGTEDGRGWGWRPDHRSMFYSKGTEKPPRVGMSSDVLDRQDWSGAGTEAGSRVRRPSHAWWQWRRWEVGECGIYLEAKATGLGAELGVGGK